MSAAVYQFVEGDLHTHGALRHAHPHSGPHEHGSRSHAHAHAHEHPHAHDEHHAHGHSHGLVDESIKRSREGVRTVTLALAILGCTAAAQALVFALTGSLA